MLSDKLLQGHGMAEMAKSDYDTLDAFIKAVLERVAEGKLSVVQAHADIMHPLTAWDIGNAPGFIPWIEVWFSDLEKDA